MQSIRSALKAATLICFLAAAAIPAHGKIDCESPVTLRIDLATGAVAGNAECVRYGGSVTVVVEHVNTMLYDVTVNDQTFRATAPMWPIPDRLEPPALPVATHGVVKDYTDAVRKLYEAANETAPNIRAILYGSPTPDPDLLRRDGLTVVRTWLGIDGDDLTAVSSAVLQRGSAALGHVERLHRDALRMGAEAGTPQPTLELVRASYEVVNRERKAILEAAGKQGLAAEDLAQELLLALHRRERHGLHDLGFPAPAGYVPVRLCVTSGKLASDACPRTTEEWLPKDRVPTERDQSYYRLAVDRRNGKPAMKGTPGQFRELRTYVNLPARYAARFARVDGKRVNHLTAPRCAAPGQSGGTPERQHPRAGSRGGTARGAESLVPGRRASRNSSLSLYGTSPDDARRACDSGAGAFHGGAIGSCADPNGMRLLADVFENLAP